MSLALDRRTCDITLRLACIGSFIWALLFFPILAAVTQVQIHLLGFLPLTASVVLAIGLVYRWRRVQPHGLEFSVHIFGRRTLQRIDFGVLVALIDAAIFFFSLVITILLFVDAFGGQYYDETACAALGSYASMALLTTTCIHLFFTVRAFIAPVKERLYHAYATAYDNDIEEDGDAVDVPLTMEPVSHMENGPSFRDDSGMMTPASSTVGLNVRVSS